MKRREFLQAAAIAVAPVVPARLAGVEPVDERTLFTSCRARRTPRGRACVALIFCPGFESQSWRDIPEGGEIVKLLEPMSLRAARQRTKEINRANYPHGRAAESRDLWAVVIATDGRLAKKGGQS